MSFFVDTNILLRLTKPDIAAGERAAAKMLSLVMSGTSLYITPQIMAEFWNVATRPQANNGLGLPIQDARRELEMIEQFFSVLDESHAVYQEWKRLVSHYNVSGVKVHDARIVAAMRIYGIPRILTFNAEDFTRYENIEIVVP